MQIDSLGCKEMLVKTAVGASGKDTYRVKFDSEADLENIVRLSTTQELLVQVSDCTVETV